MDKFEHRRQGLLRIKRERCGDNVASLARLLDKADTYVHRMLYEEGKPNKKRIGEDSVDKVREVFGVDLDDMGATTMPIATKRRLQWVDEEEAELLSMFRATDSKGRTTLLAEAQVLPKVLFDEIANHKPKERKG